MNNPLYNNKRWRKRRAAQLMAEPLCRMCTESGRFTQATVADHIEPHNNDTEKFWFGALQSLCKLHHDSAKQSFERTGVMRGSDTKGVPLHPGHHWNAA